MEKITWDDLTIKQFDELRVQSKKIDGFDDIPKLVSIMFNRSFNELMEMTLEEYAPYRDNVLEVLQTTPKPKLERVINIDGHKYEMELNLNKMKVSQHNDYNNVFNNSPDNTALLMATIYIPQGKEYGKDYDVNELAEIFSNKMKYVYAIGASSFFLTLLKSFTKVFLTSLKKKLLKKKVRTSEEEKKLVEIEALILSGIGL